MNMKSHFFAAAVIAALVFFALPISAQTYAYDVMTQETFTDTAGTELNYQIYMPEGSTDGTLYPVLLYLHGSGHRGADNQIQVIYEPGILYRVLNSEYKDCILIAPQCAEDYQWVETPWSYGSYSQSEIGESKYLHAVYELLNNILDTESADPSRVYVTGISMGGYGTWDIIERYPDMFAAAAPVCGAGDPSGAEAIKELPIWAFHGDFDHVVPPNGSRDMYAALTEAGSTVAVYTEYENVDHDSWVKAYAEPELLNWIFAQSRRAEPVSTEAEAETVGTVEIWRYVAAGLLICCGIVIAIRGAFALIEYNKNKKSEV